MTSASAGLSEFVVDAAAPGRRMKRSWELAVGSGDAWSLARADLQAQLNRARVDCGFRYLRCHGVLSDPLQSLLRNRQGELVYNWRLVDAAYDALLDCGIEPFVELAFMPEALASGDKRIFHYRANVTPPADYAVWNAYIAALVDHWRTRYGTDRVRRWYFEVWNEPNLPPFWSSTQAEYYRLYLETARTIKAVDPQLRVGGPATTMAGWLREFIAWCGANSAPLNFIATHVYPDDDQFEKTDPEYRAEYNRGGYLEKVVARAAAEVEEAAAAAGFGPLEQHWTEWNSSWRWGQPIHDSINQAAYVCRVLHAIHEHVDSFAYWTISDIFNEFPFPRTEFVGGFGMITIGGVPKPVYRGYQLLHRLGELELPATRISGAEGDLTDGSLDCWATRSNGELRVLLTNYTPPGLESRALPERQIRLSVPRLASERLLLRQLRIDAEHGNPIVEWEKMGRPGSPSREQLDQLRVASEPGARERPLRADVDGSATVELALPPGSVALVELLPG